MIIFPAIDIRGGKCVRLLKGDFEKETVFSDKPEEMAKKWQAQGAEFLHLVDLDGALAGKSQNLATVEKILAAVDIPVELGGGIRTMANIDEVLALGVRRVILGSVAVRDPELVREACAKYGDRIAVGIDTNAVAVLNDMLRQLDGDIVDALADDLDASVVDADDVALLDLLVLKDRVAHGEGDLAGLDLLRRSRHGLAVLLSRLRADVGLRARAQALGELFTDLHLDACHGP